MASGMYITDFNTMLEALREARYPEQVNRVSVTEYEQNIRAERNRQTYGEYYINAFNEITKGDL